jgi:hypothetical protein
MRRVAEPRGPGPDFICVGMPKAGTDWLGDQLVGHPDFWMPPIKEIRYLDQDAPDMSRMARRLNNARRRSGEKGEQREADERDRLFLERASAISGQSMDVAAYAHMFDVKGDCLTGDITPAYAGLTDEQVAKVGAGLPQVKVLLMVRDPVARTWSYVCMKHRAGKFDEAMLEDPKAFRAVMEEVENIEEPLPAQQDHPALGARGAQCELPLFLLRRSGRPPRLAAARDHRLYRRRSREGERRSGARL